MSERFKLAHIREQGIDLIIIPLDSSFGNKSDSNQFEIIANLEVHAHAAGLAGTVVPVWRTGSSHKFVAPQRWHPFFKGLTWNQIMTNINKELTFD